MGLHLHQDNPTIKERVMAASQEANTLTLPALYSGKGRAKCPQNSPNSLAKCEITVMVPPTPLRRGQPFLRVPRHCWAFSAPRQHTALAAIALREVQHVSTFPLLASFWEARLLSEFSFYLLRVEKDEISNI